MRRPRISAAADEVSGEQDPGEAKATAPEEMAIVEPSSQSAAMFIGTDQIVNMPLSRPPLTLAGDAVMLNFEQAPLMRSFIRS